MSDPEKTHINKECTTRVGDRVGGMKGLDMSTSRAPPALKCSLHASKALVTLTFGDRGDL